MKKINAIKTQLVVTTGTNLFQHWMQKNSKLNKTELTSLLTATTMKTGGTRNIVNLRLSFCER